MQEVRVSNKKKIKLDLENLFPDIKLSYLQQKIVFIKKKKKKTKAFIKIITYITYTFD